VARIELRGIHRVRARLADGSRREYHYAWRGGPKFWSSGDGVAQGSADYLAALAALGETPKPKQLTTPQMVDAYIDNAEFRMLKPRTQADYRRWAMRFAEEFADDPAAMFEEAESRSEINEWRQKWAHSPKQYDYAGTVATVILNWSVDFGKLRQHYCHRLRKLYSADRSEIIWTPQDIAKLQAVAPLWVQRVLTATCETGLRPGDLIRLARSHVIETSEGRVIRIRTNKRQRIAAIPVTAEMGRLIDSTPSGQLLLCVSARGLPLTAHRASEGVRQWREKAGLPDDLRLYDARGTAATRLLRAGVPVADIAKWMGWSLRTASAMIERYAAVSPEGSAEILSILEGGSGTSL